MTARLGLGTATFIPGYGLGAKARPGVDLLAAALDAGIRYVDTAAAYADSEAAIGAVAPRVRELNVRVATKLQPASPTPDACSAAMTESLARLGLPRIDTVLLHSAPTDQVESERVASAWTSLRDAGLTSRVGVSTYGIDAAGAAMSASWCDAVQVEFSILNQSVVSRLMRRRTRRVEVIARSVLCKGLLTPAALSMSLPDDAARTVTELAAIAGDLRMDLTTLAIRFAMDTPGIDVVLVGVADRAELETAVLAAERRPLTAMEYAAIAAFDRSAASWSHPERWPEGAPA